MASNLLGVRLPQTNQKEILNQIDKLPENAKYSLFFLYSEYFLRANRNPFYKHTLNKADILATDGKGALWSQYKLGNTSFFPKIFQKLILPLWAIFRVPLFLIIFLFELVFNVFSGFYILISKKDLVQATGNHLVLGRSFVYNLLDLASNKNWKVAIISGSDIDLKSKLKNLYPNIEFYQWLADPKSDLMKDNQTVVSNQNIYTEVPTDKNIHFLFPALQDAKAFLEQNPVDIIISTIGGKSGKQEFFIENIKTDNNIKFRLATGVGAAFDHLGAGAKQPKPPNWMMSFGLEWVYRFITQPYRRLRIFDSIFSLWWWTTLQEFVQLTENRLTAVNIIKSPDNKYLLAKRHTSWVTGDVGWAWFQGGVHKNEKIEDSGLRELTEETDLKSGEVKIIQKSVFSELENMHISLKRFILLKCKYHTQEKHINFVSTNTEREIKTNWENKEAKWFEKEEVGEFLVPEKLNDWEKYNATFLKS